MWQRQFSLVIIGQLVSQLGNAVLRISMSLYILDITGSAKAFSMMLALSTLPYIFLAPFAGKLADTQSKKNIMVFLDIACLVMMLVYYLALPVGNGIYITTLCMVLLSACYTLYQPAVTTSIPFIVQSSHLTRANAMVQQVGHTVNFIGPVLGSLVYSFFGIRQVVLLNMLSFLIVAVLELFLKIPDRESVLKRRQLRKNALIDMTDTVKHLAQEKKVILRIIATYAMMNLFVVPILTIVTPFFVRVVLEMPPAYFGYIESISVLGMLTGGLLVSLFPHVLSIKRVHHTMYPLMVAVAILSVVTFLSVAHNRSTYTTLLIAFYALGSFLIMFSIAVSNILTLSYTQSQVAKERLGQVSAFSTAVATMSIVPGQLMFGFFIDAKTPVHVLMLISFLLTYGVYVFMRAHIAGKSLVTT